MTAQEKARDLVVEKFFTYCKRGEQDSFKERFEETKHNAKKCALIAVNEIINEITAMIGGDNPAIKKYWEEVRKEILKL